MNARQQTVNHRRDNVERLARALPCSLLEATPELLQQWQDDLALRLIASSVSTYTSSIKVFYAWATRHGHLEHDPARDLQAPRRRRAKARPIGEDPLRVALACCRDEQLQAWLILAAFCGLRAGEIARMRGEDVGDETLDVDGKGGYPRTVPLPPQVREVLAPFVTGTGPVWRTSRLGRRVSPKYVSRQTNDFLHGAGTGATLHMLRHRFATRMYQLSKDPKMVQELLGHASLDTTTRYLAVAAERGRTTAAELATELPRLRANRSGAPAAPDRRAA